MGSIEVTLISGRTAQQGIGLEVGKTSTRYHESASYIELSLEDAEEMGHREDQPVMVSTSHGSVVVTGKLAKGLDPGMAFIPYGLWANQVYGSETGGTGMPSFKGVRATVEPAEGKKVPSLMELVEGLRGG